MPRRVTATRLLLATSKLRLHMRCSVANLMGNRERVACLEADLPDASRTGYRADLPQKIRGLGERPQSRTPKEKSRGRHKRQRSIYGAHSDPGNPKWYLQAFPHPSVCPYRVRLCGLIFVSGGHGARFLTQKGQRKHLTVRILQSSGHGSSVLFGRLAESSAGL